MEIHFHERTSIELYNDEIATFREIVRLAADRLASAPAHQLHGVPLERQAGLAGVDLFRARSMLEKFGNKFGLDITEEKWNRSTEIPERGDGEKVQPSLVALATVITRAED